MCNKSTFEDYLFNALCTVNDFIDCVGAFYSEYSLPDKKLRFNFSDFEKIADEAIEILCKVNKLNTKHEYSDEHIAEKIFSDLDDKWLFICNTQAIIGSVKRKKEHVMRLAEHPLDDPSLIGVVLSLHDILVDVSTFLMRFANWKSIDTRSWPHAFKRNRVTAFEVFASGIHMSKRITHINDFSIPPLSIFLLRQAIELKVCEILNIGIIIDTDGEIVKITGDKFLPLLNEKYFILPVKKSILAKIYTWTNAYVHLGLIDYFWKVEFAQSYLFSLFKLSEKPVASRSYYENDLLRDIKAEISGECSIIPMNSPNSIPPVELVDNDLFLEISEGVKKHGFETFCQIRQREYIQNMERAMRQNDM